MNVLRHNDISQNDKPITPSHPFKYLQKQIATVGVVEKWLAPVTTEREKVRISPTIETMQTLSHEHRLEKDGRALSVTCEQRGSF
jgi:hypothetical protein